MNDTPETDKATIASGGDWCPVLRETCRRLERERDNEMKWHHQTHKELVETQCKLMDITQERDEAMAKYDIFLVENMLEVNKLCKERDEWSAMCGGYKQERDEAFEELRKLSGAYEDATNYYARIIELIDERDDALEELRKLKIILDVIKNETL